MKRSLTLLAALAAVPACAAEVQNFGKRLLGLNPTTLQIVLAQPKVQANLEGKQVVKVIHVGGKLVNIVVR